MRCRYAAKQESSHAAVPTLCGYPAHTHFAGVGCVIMKWGLCALAQQALIDEAQAAGLQLDHARVITRAWGCSRPLVWCFGQPGMEQPYDPLVLPFIPLNPSQACHLASKLFLLNYRLH